MLRLSASVFGFSLLAAASAGGLPDDVRDALLDGPDPSHLSLFHSIMASQPHDAGTPGDRAMIDALAGWFESFGLEVERQELYLYLSSPVSASVSILPGPGNAEAIELPIREAPVEGDPFSANDELRPGWNAYAGSGTVEAEIVYANYGRLEDFEELERLGVETEGKIILARYGGNYRGYKAKFAEQAGAAGLIIFTDPADSGWGRGLPYPLGGYANETYIQRGSIKTLPYYGDPLTPFIESTKDADRLDPAEVGLPTIPVQPVPWQAAQEILSRMTGEEVSGGWQGGLPMRYRITGGADLRVKLQVEQKREIVETANVLGTLRGSKYPDEVVIIGCHHDAWGYGAGDPTSGLMCLVEAARVFGEMAKNGWRPERSIVFAAWAAEEHGILGSVEYVESRADWLMSNAVAYLNLDGAAMGPDFRSAASPSLRGVIAEAARHVPQPGGEAGERVWHRWSGNAYKRVTVEDNPVISPGPIAFEENSPAFGSLGGGSDHVGFLCYVCVPSASLSGGGARGTAYHSTYDNLGWYRAVVGEDYESARMVTRMTLLTAAMLAERGQNALDLSAYAIASLESLDFIERIASDSQRGQIASANEPIRQGIDVYQGSLVIYRIPILERLFDDSNFDSKTMIINRSIERAWCDDRFDDGRPWYRNGFAAPDATSGYAAWILPGLRAALQDGDMERYEQQARVYADWFIERAEEIREAYGIAEDPAESQGPKEP